MPNFDSGQYFLTALVPVKNRRLARNGESISSPVHVLRQRLESMPTAMQTRITQAKNVNSPFSRNTRTHFARLVVIDDVAYNGREQPTTLYSTILSKNPIIAQKADQLSCPYLLFVADFDAASGDDGELDSYLGLLWATMETELRDIFEFCFEFEKVGSATDFAGYIKKCQIETTMPFHDYWEGRPVLGDFPLAGWKLALPVAGTFLLGAFLGHRAHLPWPLYLLTLTLFAGIAVYFTLAWIKRLSLRPIPGAPDSSLPDVLKALYLQRAFASFAMRLQASGPQELHEAFGAFIAAHQPGNRETPTQDAGTIPV